MKDFYLEPIFADIKEKWTPWWIPFLPLIIPLYLYAALFLTMMHTAGLVMRLLGLWRPL